MSKLLIVEDNQTLCRMMETWLTAEQHVVDAVFTGTEGLERILFYKYDLVILDWDLPGATGIEICQKYRAGGGKNPILMLTGKKAIKEREFGLDSGSDDYLTKPFDMKELSARVRALLRRLPEVESEIFAVEGLSVDLTTCTVSRDGKPIHLIPREFDLLAFLIRNMENPFPAETLISRIWSSDANISADSVKPHINRLRAKIDVPGQPSLIKTERGRGYMFSLNKDS